MKSDQEKIEAILDDADMDAEGANYHDRVGLARAVFDAVEKLVVPENHVALAKQIRKACAP